MPTVNEILRDQVLLRAVLEQQLQLGHLIRLDTLFVDARRSLERAMTLDSPAAVRLVRADVARKLDALQSVYAPLTESAVSTIITAATEAGSSAYAFWDRTIRQAFPGDLGSILPFQRVNPSLIQAIGEAEALGRTPAGWGQKTASDFLRRARLQMQQAVGFGESVGQATTRLLRLNESLGRVGAERMARTAFSQASARVAETWQRANKDLLTGWTFTATLDTSTCQVCGGFDGQVYPVDEGPHIPVHARCRCVRAPALKSFRELGFDIPDPEAAGRASMDGRIPRRITFDQWLRQQSADRQRLILGQARHKIWLSQGQPPLGRYTDGDSILTLEQILRRG